MSFKPREGSFKTSTFGSVAGKTAGDFNGNPFAGFVKQGNSDITVNIFERS